MDLSNTLKNVRPHVLSAAGKSGLFKLASPFSPTNIATGSYELGKNANNAVWNNPGYFKGIVDPDYALPAAIANQAQDQAKGGATAPPNDPVGQAVSKALRSIFPPMFGQSSAQAAPAPSPAAGPAPQPQPGSPNMRVADAFNAMNPPAPGVPMPQPRPQMGDPSVPLPQPRPQMGDPSVPLPQARPQGPQVPPGQPLSLAPPNPGPSAPPPNDPSKVFGFSDSPAYMGQGSTVGNLFGGGGGQQSPSPFSSLASFLQPSSDKINNGFVAQLLKRMGG